MDTRRRRMRAIGIVGGHDGGPSQFSIRGAGLACMCMSYYALEWLVCAWNLTKNSNAQSSHMLCWEQLVRWSPKFSNQLSEEMKNEIKMTEEYPLPDRWVAARAVELYKRWHAEYTHFGMPAMHELWPKIEKLGTNLIPINVDEHGAVAETRIADEATIEGVVGTQTAEMNIEKALGVLLASSRYVRAPVVACFVQGGSNSAIAALPFDNQTTRIVAYDSHGRIDPNRGFYVYFDVKDATTISTVAKYIRAALTTSGLFGSGQDTGSILEDLKHVHFLMHLFVWRANAPPARMFSALV